PNRRSPCDAYSQALDNVPKTSIDPFFHGAIFGAETKNFRRVCYIRGDFVVYMGEGEERR
ncbi:MAG: hypothetical protein J5722_09305, partial [Oscillospiraceae bacterium]|nr:hypothetical protein [Oscillospiraceae bacterium]